MLGSLGGSQTAWAGTEYLSLTSSQSISLILVCYTILLLPLSLFSFIRLCCRILVCVVYHQVSHRIGESSQYLFLIMVPRV